MLAALCVAYAGDAAREQVHEARAALLGEPSSVGAR